MAKQFIALTGIVVLAWATKEQAAIIPPPNHWQAKDGDSGEAGMHTVDMLEQAIEASKALGYRVRQEWLGGSGGGGCEIKGQKWIFLDLALSPADQLAQVAEAMQADPRTVSLSMHPALRSFLTL